MLTCRQTKFTCLASGNFTSPICSSQAMPGLGGLCCDLSPCETVLQTWGSVCEAATCVGSVSSLLQIDLRSDQERKHDKQPLLLEGAEVRTVKRSRRMAEVGWLHACPRRQLWQEHWHLRLSGSRCLH